MLVELLPLQSRDLRAAPAMPTCSAVPGCLAALVLLSQLVAIQGECYCAAARVAFRPFVNVARMLAIGP